MKKICIYLMELHRLYYLLLGVLIGIFVFSIRNIPQEMLIFYPSPLITTFFVMSPFLIHLIAYKTFYSREELTTKDIHIYRGHVLCDNYFTSKIKAGLSKKELFWGYVYAISRPVAFINAGYLLSVILFLIISKRQ